MDPKTESGVAIDSRFLAVVLCVDVACVDLGCQTQVRPPSGSKTEKRLSIYSPTTVDTHNPCRTTERQDLVDRLGLRHMEWPSNALG